eukprot:69228_1
MIEIDDDEQKSNDSIPLQLALKYHFITPWTSMIVVKQKDTNECQPINCSPLKRSVIKKEAAYKQTYRYISNDMSQLHVPEQDTGNYDEEYDKPQYSQSQPNLQKITENMDNDDNDNNIYDIN